MSDERRKMNKQSTGTVPKAKCRNNTSNYPNEQYSAQSWTNNLAADFSRLNQSDYLRNSRINRHVLMNTTFDEQRLVNGSPTPTASRRSSGTVPKCDNVSKYPDKRQIEDKLNQIRDYLQITTSLMSNMKNTDEQSLLNGQDSQSEASTSNNDSNREMEQLRDQQLALLSLQQKAENKLKDARLIQEKMAHMGCNKSGPTNKANMSDIDAMIKELDERSRRFTEPTNPIILQDKLLAEVNSLQNQLINLHTVNEDRNQLIEVLDNRDMELRAQHYDLQAKLTELQSRKHQVDQLVDQLQTMNAETEPDDVGVQVRRICTMKDQLSTLKDMLEIVKTTEHVNQNPTNREEPDSACASCSKAENTEKSRTKQVNKNGALVRAELEAKKRELEDIMGKHKAGTSNLNHDVGSVDNKSEFSCSSTFGAQPNRCDSSDDDFETFSLPVLNYQRQVRTPDRVSQPETQNRGQITRQLELIRSVCNSMLDGGNQQPVQQLRNNLTPNQSPHPNLSNTIMNSGDFEPNWMNSNLQTQAFMMNTLNQCCQMLWLQQRELMNLRQVVGQIQDRCDLQFNLHTMQQSGGEGERKQVPVACSMPNLNQYHHLSVNDPNSYQNSIGLNNVANDAINNSVLHGVVNPNINQMQGGQIWNGQALNNQVAPGNRANNYWDNFRSYSRQNLLKGNEGFQNQATIPCNSSEHAQAPRTNPFSQMTQPKSNSEHQQSSSIENTPRRTPQRRTQFASPIRSATSTKNNLDLAPPDVLNVKIRKSSNDCDVGFNEPISLVENDETITKNEWHEDSQQNGGPNQKSKLFEELRENVYREVVNLISANEARPHFLIQLFRDLQMISSDPLRLKILQSIQAIITSSLAQQNRQTLESEQNTETFSLQSTVWSKTPKAPLSTPYSMNPLQINGGVEMHATIKEIIPYLNDREDEIIDQTFLQKLNEQLIESESFQATVRDSVFKIHFSRVLGELLNEYQSKKVRDVKMHIIQTINDFLKGELSYMQLIQETYPDNCNLGDLRSSCDFLSNGFVQTTEQVIENADLAEADQQGGVNEEELEEEEEGAVGGFWDLQLEPSIVGNEEEDVLSVDYGNNNETQFIKQGLDQVPTRLPTKSRSNTPNKDRSGSSRSNHQF